jgi:transcriptional regulator with XRE-family HTH domain/predicted transcriptional regulator
MASVQDRMIFGLKIRQYRQEKGWNFDELSRQSGISVSYLNEIEKGKKYPKPENRQKLAKVFGVDEQVLISPRLTKQYAPIGELLQSNFLNELPLDLFGIQLQEVVEIIAKAPDRVNAFISALLDLARNYSLRDEHFFLASLRAYQELHFNYFEDLEQAATAFLVEHQLPAEPGITSDQLSQLLCCLYGYRIQSNGFGSTAELSQLRSIYLSSERVLLLRPELTEQQRLFQLAKEIGFNALQLKERPITSSLLKVNSFEEVLNNFKAAYFAVCLLINREYFTERLKQLFEQTRWDENAFLSLLQHLNVRPSVLFQRFNVLSPAFDLHKIFFFRIAYHPSTQRYEMEKELQLNRRHQPHASGLNEHYCRRWLAIRQLEEIKQQENPPALVSGLQRATFIDTGEEYLCISVAEQGTLTTKQSSVFLGILLDAPSKATLRFVDDPSIPRENVNVTCERCSQLDCTERVAPPMVLQKKEQRKATLEALDRLVNTFKTENTRNK